MVLPRYEDFCERLPGDVATIGSVFSEEGLTRQDQDTDAAIADETSYPGVPRDAARLGEPRSSIDRIGRYRIVKPLGQGAFGDVYLAYDPELRRQVAIKLPRQSETALPDDAFRREAELAARVRHPGITSIFDIGRRRSGAPYIVMEYLPGGSLRDRMADGPMPWHQSVEMMLVIARAVHHAHSVDLVHRDLKPSNILLDEDGNPHVADLGLAIDIRDSDAAEELAGTFSYMAPEQIATVREPVDSRCDIWALGVILFEMLCGRRPYAATTLAELRAHIQGESLSWPAETARHIPRRLQSVCEKCLSKEVASRYASAQDLATDLAVVHADREPSLLNTKNRATAIIVAIAVSILSVSLYFWRDNQTAQATTASQGSLSTLDSMVRNTPPSKEDFYAPYITDPNGQFLIVGRTQQFATLQEAVHDTSDGDIIEIQASGKIVVGYVEFGDRSVTVRAADGCQPVLVPRFPGPTPLFTSNARLVLEGLEFRAVQHGRRRQERGSMPALVESLRGNLHVANCRFYLDGVERTCCIFTRESKGCEIRNCEFYTAGGAAVQWRPTEGTVFRMSHCVHAGRKPLMVRYPRAGRCEIILSNNSVAADVGIGFNAIGSSSQTKWVRLQLDMNRLSLDTLVWFATGNEKLPYPIEEVASKAIVWHDSGNVYEVRRSFLCTSQRFRTQNVAGLGTLTAWTRFVEGETSGSRIAAGLFDLTPSDRLNAHTLKCDDLHVAGQGGNQDAPPVGANLDLVGPGPAYDRWRQTADYLTWRAGTREP